MLIINKYDITTPDAAPAVDGAGLVTGRAGERWGGANPNLVTGVTGNFAAGVGLVFVSATTNEIKTEVISKLVEVKITGTLIAAGPVVNAIKIPLANVGISGSKVIKGMQFLGVFDANATNTGVTPTASLLMIVPETAATFSIVKDAIIIEMAAASTALFQNKSVMLLLYYSNY